VVQLQTWQRRYAALVAPPPSNTQSVIKDFVKKLKNFIAWWTSMPDPDITFYGHFTNEHRCHAKIVSDALYQHKNPKLTYTTYDMQEDKDRIYQW
jgi:hypothetical protein